MNKPDPKLNPCFYYTEEAGRSENCHGKCERFAKSRELNEQEKKKKHDFDKEHAVFMTEAAKNITIKNQKKYNRYGTRRK